MLIRVADDCQPQSTFFQMSSYILDKPFSIMFRTERMETASVKCKSKRSTVNFVLEKIGKYEIAFNAGLRSLFFCLLQSIVRSISSNNLKAVLGKPYGIVSGPTANI